MERVQLTEEMSQRIQSNLREMDWETPQVTGRRPRWTHWAMAACLAAVLFSTALLTQRPSIPPDPPPPVTAVPNFTQAGSAEELSDLVAFPIQDLQSLPFEPLETRYTAYGGGLAEIRYINGEEGIIFRKSVGSEDNSGDYTNYDASKELSVGDYVVTLRGTADRYPLAVWQDGEFTYSIRSLTALPATDWVTLLDGVSEGKEPDPFHTRANPFHS